jgi:hypothetical protein
MKTQAGNYQPWATICLYTGTGTDRQPGPISVPIKEALESIEEMLPRPMAGDEVVDIDVDVIHVAAPGWRISLFLSDEMGTREMAAEWGDEANRLHLIACRGPNND